MYIFFSGQKILISPGPLSVFSWNFGKISRRLIKKIYFFSVLSLKYEVSAHDEVAISQYHS